MLYSANDNNIYAACDRNSTIAALNCSNYEVKNFYVPNNGVMEICEDKKLLFVSNTSDIGIYDMDSFKLLSSIKGFMAVTCIKFDKKSKKLYVLDKLLHELRVYNIDDSNNFILIYKTGNLKMIPSDFLVSENSIYISFEGNKILKINKYNKFFKYITLDTGCNITSMALNSNILYAADQGLNKIEIINDDNLEFLKSININSSSISKILLSKDNTKLFCIERNPYEYGCIDIIDTNSNQIISKILLDKKCSEPYDIAIFSSNTCNSESSSVSPKMALRTTKYIKNPVKILVKRIFASKHENIEFSEVNVKLPETEKACSLLNIKFKNGSIVKGSEIKTQFNDKPGLFKIQFAMRIMYTIYYSNGKENSSFENFLESMQCLTLLIPENKNIDNFEIILNSHAKLESIPVLSNSHVKFKLSVPCDIKITAYDEILVPSLTYCSQSRNCKEYIQNTQNNYETFLSIDDYSPYNTIIQHDSDNKSHKA